MINKTILIIEDDKEVQTLLRFILEKEGYNIIQVENGREALEILGIEKTGKDVIIPDIVLLDIMLPEVDGYTILKKMELVPALFDLPVVVVTAKPLMSDLFLMSRNVKHFFSKPFNTKMLRDKIKELIG
ncbi:MAG: hypothetical protein A2252_03410 [Elusimicrobia bacterium RIFOXYA2_FULL_39_19]|nr:MAG: hypothetical protein A2252_03410 [Elusimicrobia bacterium RIFOXYA2_FULL_39_19]